RLLYCLVILRHERRLWVSFGVTTNPTAEWISRQITEAFPWDSSPRYLIRDRDTAYGVVFRQRLRAMGIRDKPTAPRSPWQNPYVERLSASASMNPRFIIIRGIPTQDPAQVRLPEYDHVVETFPLIFGTHRTLILGAGIFFYVLLDGFDLGVGILYNFMPDTRSRNLVMNAIAPVWDGNETWLVLGGVALLAAFPLAFAILIPALYFPILVMLLALVFRGVAFEFRFRDVEHKTFWDHGFFYGSLIATMAQGMMLGAFIQGFKVEGRVFAGGPLDFL